jgi:hypothetical protein
MLTAGMRSGCFRNASLKELSTGSAMISRSHLKNVFWPNIFVGASFKILNIQQYASGFKLGPAAILNQNPIFEMGSI